MAFNWDEDNNNNDTFRDIPDEVNAGQQEPNAVIHAGHQSQPLQPLPSKGLIMEQPLDAQDEQFLAAVLEDGEEDYEAVLADANLRIDLASLYKLIMNHDFFEGMDVDQRAIDTVHKEVRKFARERMEIMLGMRQEAAKESMVSSPFNDLEVVVLKKLASTYSKGATETADAARPQPAAKAIARKEGINPITAVAKKPTAKQAVVKAALVSKPQAPLQRQNKAVTTQMEDTYKPPTKAPTEVTTDELLARNAEALARQAGRKAKSTTSIPMPNEHQEAMFQEQRVLTSDNPLASPNAVSAIVNALNKSKSQ